MGCGHSSGGGAGAALRYTVDSDGAHPWMNAAAAIRTRSTRMPLPSLPLILLQSAVLLEKRMLFGCDREIRIYPAATVHCGSRAEGLDLMRRLNPGPISGRLAGLLDLAREELISSR